MTVLVTLLGVAVGLLGVLVVGLLRSHADVLRALHDLGVAEEALGGTDSAATAPPPAAAPARVTGTSMAHDLIGRSPDGAKVAVTVDGAGHSTLIAFLTSACSTCRGFWDAFASPQLELPDAADRLVIVTKGPANESPAAISELAPVATPVVMTDDAFDDYDVSMAPYFILVDGPSGSIVGEGAALGWTQVAGLLEKATADGTLAPRSTTPPERSGGPPPADEPTRIDAELRAAGIEPGHPSLYPEGAGLDPAREVASAEHEHD